MVSERWAEMKIITFAVPCFNSADYMEKCVYSLLPLGEDIEIILIDDGSTKDNTAEICDRLVAEHPGVIRAIHQENAGHGGAVNSGLAAATGRYFKVVDSDDWLDGDAMSTIMAFIRSQASSSDPIDLVISNYVYEKVYEGTRISMGYRNVFPENEIFTWDDIGHFHLSQYLLMHSVIYRTDLLRGIGLELPKHCFYVDNIFVYVPLAHVRSMVYFDVDAYRYFIGREDQSVNEKVMLSRIDQQLRVTKEMIDAVDLDTVENKKLQHYLYNYLSMMLCICTVFLRMEDTPENEHKRKELWHYLHETNPHSYRQLRKTFLSLSTNIPTMLGRQVALRGYRIAQRVFKFN